MRFTDFLPKRSSTALMISVLNCSRVAISVSCSTAFVPSVDNTMSRNSASRALKLSIAVGVPTSIATVSRR